MAQRWTALIAHHDQLVVEVLSAACERCGVTVVGHTSLAQDLPKLYSRLAPDVVVSADRFGDVLLEDVLTELLDLGARLIVLTDDPSIERMVSLLGREIMGCCSYDAGPTELAEAFAAVARGAVALTPNVARNLLEEWRRTRFGPPAASQLRRPALTPRERDIVVAMAEGLSGKGIAARLGVTLKTVENHKVRVFDKLGVRTQAHAVTVALASGLAGVQAPRPGHGAART